jgi:CheY-like chemotaxis protein
MTTSPFENDPARGRVLLLEDASVFREMQSLLLQRAGFAVTVCEGPASALSEAARQPFDVAVLNSDTPGLDRPEFIQALRRHRPSLAIIFVAGALTVELTRDLTSAGVRTILQRPVNPIALLQKVDEAMGITIQPGSSRMFSLPADASPTDHSAVPSAGPSSPSQLPPFASDSSSPFGRSDTRPPFRADSTPPFGAVRSSAYSPYRSQSISPFTAARAR